MPQLTWLGDHEAKRTTRKVPYRLLDPVEQVGDPASGNLLIQGDNLEALKALLPFYAGRVKCIFIDPPYNTQSAFEHYDDNLEHSQWLSMMYPRLELLRDLLSDDGSIWVTIDDNEGHYLKVLMDEIFHRRNFIGEIVWQKRTSRENRAAMSSSHDTLLLYARKPVVLWKEVRNLLPPTGEGFSNPDNDSRGPWKSIPFTAQGFRENQMYPITAPNGALHRPHRGRCWSATEPEFLRLKEEKRIYFPKGGDGRPRVKAFPEHERGLVPMTVWFSADIGDTEDAKKEILALFAEDSPFSTPKPEHLIQRIVQISSNQDDLVLDSFLGSGTTAAVAHKMGRRWIGIEMGEHAQTHCLPRLKKVIEGEQGGISESVGWQGGGGFRYLKLGEPAFRENGRINPVGRVLRLPYAKRRIADTLNRDYAHVSAPTTAQIANELADRLVAMGFEEVEAAQFIQPQIGDLFDPTPALRTPPAAQTTIELPAAVAKALQTAAPSAVAIASGPGEHPHVTLTGILPAKAVEAAIAATPRRDREAVQAQIDRHQTRAHVAAAPSQRKEVFAPVPLLALPVQGELVLYDPSVLDEMLDFSLSGAAADLPSFELQKDPRPYLIDIEAGRLRVSQDLKQFVLNLNVGSDGIRREDVIRELDRRVRSQDFIQANMIAWLGRVLDGLLARGIELTYCARHINQLADAVGKRIEEITRTQRRQAFQQSLLPGERAARLDANYNFRFDPNDYPARWLFTGRYNFSKHFYPLPGELADDPAAEETACAIEIDSLAEVKYWVRNLERQPQKSFWLPTSTDRFYPDFVAELDNGRLLVIEYKGGDRYSNDDSREKRDIGKVWAAASGGRCLFAMVTDATTAGKPVGAQLREALRT